MGTVNGGKIDGGLMQQMWYNGYTSMNSHRDARNVRWRGMKGLANMHSDYNTAKTCTKCGKTKPATAEFFHSDTSKKDGLYSSCKECAHKQKRSYYANNRERVIASARTYRIENRDKVIERGREYYLAHKNDFAEKARQYHRDNREIIIDRVRKWRQENPERHRETKRAWRAAHREEKRASGHRYRARKRAAAGKHTGEDIRVQYDRQKGRCYYCNNKVGDNYHVDHIVPLSRGGSDDPENLVIACPTCNNSKYDKLPHEWAEGGRLL